MRERIVARVRVAADPAAIVEAYGSSVYAPAHAHDVDVLVAGEPDPARLATALGLALLPTTPTRLHGQLDGVPVDVTLVASDDLRAGPRDAAMLVAALREHDREATFDAIYPEVRRFVQLRALGRNGLGYFGGLGWAMLLAVPLVADPAVRDFAAWLRWMSKLAIGARVGFDGVRANDPEPLYVVGPSLPPRSVVQLSKRAATVLFAELRAALAGPIVDLAGAPPPGTTLAITGDDPITRGRYEGTVRGLLRELEAICAIRSWGRFEGDDTAWQHRITLPAPRAAAVRTLVEDWLALNNLDATVA